MSSQAQFILESPRLQLRNLKESDLADFLHYRSRPEVARYQFWEPFDEKKSMEYILTYKDSLPGIPGEWFQLGIVLKSENKLIGDCAIKQDKDEPRKADIGCSLSPDYQGNGYAREALSLLLDYYFREMDLHRVVGIADSKNHRAVRLMEGLHMRREGHFIKNIWFKGDWGDEYAYAVLKEEWLHPGRKS
jgi:ribosomal-protein-alanine N-acetyltransferase